MVFEPPDRGAPSGCGPGRAVPCRMERSAPASGSYKCRESLRAEQETRGKKSVTIHTGRMNTPFVRIVTLFPAARPAAYRLVRYSLGVSPYFFWNSR